MDDHHTWCWQHLQQARWFGGKGRPARLAGLTALPWWSTPVPGRAGVRSEIAEVHYADGGRAEHYHLLLAHGPDDVGVRDATTDPVACRLLWNGLRRAARDGSGGVLEVDLRRPLPASPAPRLFDGEQSNTSLWYGDLALVKVFRRLEPGRNPDIEIHDALGRTGCPEVAELFGQVTAQWLPADAGPHDAPRTADLAMVVEQFVGATDGWALAVERCAAGVSFAREAAGVGRALGSVHTALRNSLDSTSVPGAELVERLSSLVDRHAAVAPVLQPHLAALRQRLSALTGRTVEVQRLHGDCHLGQVLHTGDGWKWIDFEGEPSRTVAERRVPDSPWRDVAGVLRSFRYAAASVPGSEPTWCPEAQDAFLAGYLDSVSWSEDAGLVTAYLAERAAYEVAYEIRNRPDWVSIPLGDITAFDEESP